MAGILNTEWLNSNARRAYPFEENMPLTPRDPLGNILAGITLPLSMIVDMVLTIPGTNNMRIYLSQVVYSGTLLSLVFRVPTFETIAVGITIDPTAHVTNAAYNLVGSGDWDDVRGWINLGDLSALSHELPQGAYAFTAADTLLETRVIRPALRGIRSLRIENNGNESAKIYEHVKLIAGTNVKLEYDPAVNGIWVHAAGDAGYTEACTCADTPESNIVRTINGIATENVTITGDGECVEVTTSGNKISIRDVCSEPCCGCPELDYLNTNMKILETSLTTLTEYAERLAERVTTFVTNFVLTS